MDQVFWGGRTTVQESELGAPLSRQLSILGSAVAIWLQATAKLSSQRAAAQSTLLPL